MADSITKLVDSLIAYTEQEARETRAYVDARIDSIRAGARRTKPRFKL